MPNIRTALRVLTSSLFYDRHSMLCFNCSFIAVDTVLKILVLLPPEGPVVPIIWGGGRVVKWAIKQLIDCRLP